MWTHGHDQVADVTTEKMPQREAGRRREVIRPCKQPFQLIRDSVKKGDALSPPPAHAPARSCMRVAVNKGARCDVLRRRAAVIRKHSSRSTSSCCAEL
eukprot:218155-Pleurochrysis_carterae.AAC.2